MHKTEVVYVFGSFNCDDFGSHLTKTHQSQQIRILHKKKNIFSEMLAGKYVPLLYMYSILGRSFALITLI